MLRPYLSFKREVLVDDDSIAVNIELLATKSGCFDVPLAPVLEQYLTLMQRFSFALKCVVELDQLAACLPVMRC